MKKYKGYKIDTKANEWGYFEAIPKDCDSAMIFNKTIIGLKNDIDECI